MGKQSKTEQTSSVNPEQLNPELIEIVASVCHSANAAYCLSLGDASQVIWPLAPDWQRASAINGVRFHLANPDAGDSASHDSWMAEKIADGWVYGETKDPEKKTHPCIVPFEELPKEQQFKDALFRTVVHALAPQLETAAHNFTEMQLKIEANDTVLDELLKDRDALQAKLAKIEAEPKAKRAPKVAKTRKVGPVDGQPSLDELLELIGMAETVDIAFSDGEKEIAIEPRRIEGKAWAMTAVGLVLRLPEFIVHGPLTAPVTLAGYGLILDGELVAFARRSEPLEVAPGRRMDLRNDVVFSAG